MGDKWEKTEEPQSINALQGTYPNALREYICGKKKQKKLAWQPIKEKIMTPTHSQTKFTIVAKLATSLTPRSTVELPEL